MLKAAATCSDGSRVLLVGLSDKNVERIVSGDPAMFNVSDVGLPSQLICIAMQNDDGEVLAPQGLPECIGIAFDQETLCDLKNNAVGGVAGELQFMVMGGTDEDSMFQSLRSFIGEHTVVRDKRSITSRPPSNN